jgi:tetratricopeptide (TPR) repeat protein
VIGKEFWRGAVTDLSPEDEQSLLGASLMSLVRKDLVQPARSIFPGEDGFRFRHILIRDAAYMGIPKETRAELHERLAGWMERAAGERVNEIEEILGYHLEQAYRYRAELGPVGDAGAALAARAGERLAAAGRRAVVGGGDVGAAANLISRAVSLLPSNHPLRGELLIELASALMATGAFKDADDVLGEALAEAVEAGDARLEARASIEREFHKIFAGSAEASLTIPEVTARAIPVLEEAGDHLGLARAWRLRGEVAVLAGRWGARVDALDRALEHARLAANEQEEITLVGLLVMALYFGPTPVDEAIARCEGFLAEMSGEPLIAAAISSVLAGLIAMRGDFGEARRLWGGASDQYEELGLPYRRAVRSTIAADIETLAGDDEAAERELRWGYETLERMGEKGARAVIAAFLAETLSRQDRNDEADLYIGIAAELAAADDLVPQVLCRSVGAKVLASRGIQDQAEALAREAAAMVEGMDFPDLQALTLLSLAEVLGSTGAAEESAVLVEQVRALYDKKGNVVAGRRMVHAANTKGRP